MTATQPGLNLRIAARTVLVDVTTVRAKEGVDAESITAMIENFEYLWVFNIALGEKRADYRFWAREVLCRETCAGMRLSEVVNTIVGAGATVARAEIEKQWVCSAQHVMRLIRTKDLHESTPGRISRASLVEYLTRCWYGNDPALARFQKGEA